MFVGKRARETRKVDGGRRRIVDGDRRMVKAEQKLKGGCADDGWLKLEGGRWKADDDVS